MRQDDHTAVLSRSFGEVAGEYDRLRSGPSAESLDWLLCADATDVLEIGAGTGILTRLLAARVDHVTAVEPDERMRAVLSESGVKADVRAGHGEELPVDTSSYDVVIAASAWHWVDEARAVPEAARVLRPGGRLALTWNGVDRSVDWMRSLWAGGVDLSPDEKVAVDRRRRSRHVVDLEAGGPSPFLEPETRLFHWTRRMAKGDLISMAATYSAVITMDDEARTQHLESMRRYLDAQPALAGQDFIDVPMRSYCWRAAKA
jgi:SAM-dependent methyltransferase